MLLNSSSLSAEEAKAKTFEHLEHVDALCRRQFPGNEALATEAQNAILRQLASDDWKRVRAWRGQSRFKTFLAVVVRRLLTDFYREKFGHIRKPRWLQDKGDPLWDSAFELLILKRYERQEAIETLVMKTGQERVMVSQVVSTILGKCKPAVSSNPNVSLKDAEVLPASNPIPLEGLINEEDQNFARVLLNYIESQAEEDLTEEGSELLRRLRPHLELTDEDCLLLRLRVIEELKMPDIARRLSLAGDSYKRYHKLIGQLRDACQRAGI